MPRVFFPFIIILIYLLNIHAAPPSPSGIISPTKTIEIDQEKICPPNYIKCPESNQCILIAALCDGIKHCSNGSDEGSFCNQANQMCQSSQCKYGCKPMPNGPLCYCPEGRFYNGTDCEDVNITLPFLIYSTNNPSAIKVVSNEEFPHIVLPPLYLNAHVFAFTAQSSKLYFTDMSRKAIFSYDLFNQSFKQPFINQGLSQAGGLASDEFNLYWTDSLLGTVNVAPLNSPTIHKVLIRIPHSKPGDLVVSRLQRSMIWVDKKWNRPKFYQALMDGSSYSLLPIELKDPKGLTLHSDETSILWWDQGVCYMYNLTTQQQTRILTTSKPHPFPTSLVSINDTFTWLEGPNLFRAKTDSETTSIVLDLQPELLTKFTNHSVKPFSNQICDHLYLPLPSNNYTCACKTGFKPHFLNKSQCVEIKSCGPNEYQCSDDSCIPESFVCDGEQDCPLLNEELTCATVCPKHKFRCASGQCVTKSWRCDGRPDCHDGSDELDCDFCPFPGHKCDNATVCLNASQICDGVTNCEDGTDEPLNCTSLQENCDCEDLCHLVGNETRCSCHPGRRLAANGRNCSDDSICNNWGVCSQFCTPHQTNASHFTCSCAKGYYLAADKFSCLHKDTQNPVSLIYSTGTTLQLFNITRKIGKALNTKNHKMIVNIDIEMDTKNGTMLYWSEKSQKKIFRSQLIDGKPEVVIEGGLESVEGLTLDWVQHRLYWIDASLKHIEMSGLKDISRTRIISNLGKPRSLAIDSIARYLFWGDWEKGRACIERSHLSGQNREIIVELSKVDGIPNGITLDFAMQRIFWVDAGLGTIHVADYSGQNQRTIRKTEEYLRPFAISLFNNDIFFTDWQRHVVAKTSQWSNSSKIEILAVSYPHIYDVKVIHPSRQPKPSNKNPCDIKNGGCSHICFSSPSDTVTCGCPYGLVLSSNNKSCIETPALLSYVTRNNLFVLDSKKELLFPSVNIQANGATPMMIDTGYFYWANGSSVYRRHLLEKKEQVLLTEVGFHPVAIAPAPHNLLYIFGQMDEGKGYLAVSKKSGEHLAPLIWEHLNEPLDLTVDQSSGNIFWAHKKVKAGKSIHYKIEMSKKDGTDRKVLISSELDTQMGEPSHLTVVSSKRQLCWLNANQSIWCVDYVNYVPLRNIVKGVKGLCTLNSTMLVYQDSSNLYLFDPYLKRSSNLVSSNSTINLVPSFNAIEHSPLSCPENCICINSNKCLNDQNHMLIYIENGSPRTVKSAHLLPSFQSSSVQYIAYNPLTDHLFWADSNHSISRVRLDGKDRKTILNSKEPLKGLASDWIGNNLYWISNSQIYVSRDDGRFPYIVLNTNEKIFSLKLHPSKGLMFWISMGTKIQRATLAGRNLQTVVTSTTPIGDFTVDTYSNCLYWSNPIEGQIEMALLDGSNHVTIVAGQNHPDSLSVNNQALFWTDKAFKEGAIFTLPKEGGDQTLVQEKLGRGLEVVSVLDKDSTLYNESNPCKHNNGGCSHLCLYEGKGSDAVCTCANRHLASDMNSCTMSLTYLLMGLKDKISSYNLLNPFDPNPPFPQFDLPGHTLIALTLDQGSHTVYFSSYKSPYLFQLDLLEGSVKPALNPSDNTPRKIEGLAFNSLDDDLYWTDSAYPSIYRLPLQRSKITPELVIRLDPYDKPRSIALDTCSMKMFWSDWRPDGARIESAYLSGAQRQVLVKEGLTQPNGITFSEGFVYWVDSDTSGQYSIGRVSSSGGSHQIIINGHGAYPYSIALHRGSIFWTDWKTKSLYLNEMFGNISQTRTVAKSDIQPMSLVAYNPLSTPCNKASYISGHGCSSSCNTGICVPSGGMSGPQCLCPYNYTGVHCEIALYTEEIPTDQVIFAIAVTCSALLLMVALIILYMYKRFCFNSRVMTKIVKHFPKVFQSPSKIIKDPKPKTCVEYYNLSAAACEEQFCMEEDCTSPIFLCNHTRL